MMMPGTVPCHPLKKNRQIYSAVVLLLVLAVSVSGVAAEDMVSPTCSDVDQFGNPVCPDLHPVDQPFVTGQETTIEIARYLTGMSSTIGRVAELPRVVQGSTTEFLKIAGLGITGSINQTRYAGQYAGPGNDATGTGPDSTPPDEQEHSGIKGRIVELAEIAGLGLKNSINQTLHADESPGLTIPGPGTPGYNVSEDGEEEPAPNILRVTYANIIRSILQFIEITTRAITRSFHGYSPVNASIRTNYMDADLVGIPIYAPVPEDKFLQKPELPVTRLVKNVTTDPSLLLTTNRTPAVALPVQPTPTPVPAPLFSLSVDSDPSGALIVLNGNRTGTTPFVMTGLEKKTYTLNLTRTGYIAYGEIVNLDMNKTIEIPLTPSMDALFVTPGKSTSQNRYGGIYVSSFPDQLGLTIDGVQAQGVTPFLYYGLTEGLHTISVTRADKESGQATYTRSVWVYRDALTTYNIDTEMILLTKRVSISPGSYSGAEFTINGRLPSGRLPATITAGCPGSFISIRKGEVYTSFLIPCTNQDTIAMNLADNQEPHPPLMVSSAPDGAEIFIDGFRTGFTTPHTFTGVSRGLHRIMVSKPGLYPIEEIITVEIRGADTSPQKIFFTMENYGEGTIVVDSLPRGAAISLNGWNPGESTPHTFDHMKIGFYEVIVDMGPKPWIEQFELIPSKVSKVVADFEI